MVISLYARRHAVPSHPIQTHTVEKAFQQTSSEAMILAGQQLFQKHPSS